ncbi:putative transcriptional regulator [Variovorax boronicumulans]|uniref:CBS domain-containing protein n=1 Tax=Variovorax boronicumulans TaxID=436515 RepID=UPI0033944B51
MSESNNDLQADATDPAAIARIALDHVNDLFHRVNRSIPADQKILLLSPSTLARDAVEMLAKHFYSQAPVTTGNKVLGVFSFRSFARRAAEYSLQTLNTQKHAPGDLTVEECMERFDFANLSDEIPKHFDALERDNGILVGTPENLSAILTPMDVLRYLFKIASPFIALSEIELALRTLIRAAKSDEEIKKMTALVLKKIYGPNAVLPESLEEMSFDNYRLLVASGDTWSSFQGVFGGSRERVISKLKDVGDLRNTLFHFKRPIADEETQAIVSVRDWLLTRVEQLSVTSRGQGT